MNFDKRVEFVFLFDVKDGNPNGDPDAGNAPRVDPENGFGFVTDVCLKRKIRNFVALTKGCEPPNDIYVKERGILAVEQRKAYRALNAEPDSKGPNEAARKWMCANYFDVRSFGAVMTTGKAAASTTKTEGDCWCSGKPAVPGQSPLPPSEVAPRFAIRLTAAAYVPVCISNLRHLANRHGARRSRKPAQAPFALSR